MCAVCGIRRPGGRRARAGERPGGAGCWVPAKGAATPQSLLPAALLEAGSRVAQAFRCPRETSSSNLYGKSLEGDEKEEVFLGQRTAMAGVSGLLGAGARWGHQERLGGSVSCSLDMGQPGKGCGPRVTRPEVDAGHVMSVSPECLVHEGMDPSGHHGTGPCENCLVLRPLHFLGAPVISLPARLPLAQGPGFSGTECVIGIY